jgi:membrane associated rhomboid family serine protease
MGAASRVLDRQRLPPWARAGARLAPFTSPTVISMAIAWLVLNLMVAVFGFSPGMGAAAVAWEAHLVGYAAGLLLVGPALWMLDRLRGAEAIDTRG